MITAPETNVKYTDEQTKQVETFKSQLVNLQADISIHSKSLRVLQDNIISATKELNGLSDKKDVLSKEVSDLEVKVETLNAILEDGKKDFEAALIESDRVKNEHNEIQASLNDQKAELNIKQENFNVEKEKLDKLIHSNKEVSKELEEKKKILNKALSSI